MLEGISENIEKLIALYESEARRAADLSAALEKREVELAESREKVAALRKELESARLEGAFRGGADASGAKAAIGGLISEIDRCIELLEN